MTCLPLHSASPCPGELRGGGVAAEPGAGVSGHGVRGGGAPPAGTRGGGAGGRGGMFSSD